MTTEPRTAASTPASRAPLLAGAAVTALLVATAEGYGPHRDELYFLRSGAEPAVGYVDNGPLTPLLAAALNQLGDGSLTVLRLWPALVAGIVVVLAGRIAAEFGATRGAQLLAAAATATGSALLILGHTLSTAVTDLLVWTLLTWLVVRGLRDGGPVWLAVGAVAGVGLQNKLLPALLLAALLAGVLLAGPRGILRSRWPWLGGLVAVLLVLPQLVWQAGAGFPLLALSSSIAAGGSVSSQPWWVVVPFQLVLVGPLLVPVWVAGLWRLARDPRLRTWRAFAVAYGLLLVLFTVTGGKPYYLAGLYPLLLAAGAAPALAWARQSVPRAAALGTALVVTLAGSATTALPVVPVDELAVSPVVAMNPDAAETVGWPEFAATVGAAVASAPGERVTVLAANYGQAGAVDHYLPAAGPAYSGHNAYAGWGPPPGDETAVVVVGYPVEQVRTWFGRVDTVARIDNGVGLDNLEQGGPVLLARDRSRPWSEIWAEVVWLG
ncbi:glycosyltransferase family 39 protein [Pseudonocardia sp. HH130630-07]|uniref:glycosyltransferase family 39 protein n=1 Tax=Pseudonocardia sp. HH130630-07 TaxID=1690815 RepID=UPI000814C8D2|nr:glycosyltransferase family 39 protein [Pseudonocardia sp. HH130630-07]ANY08386.1 hypothetical protein AFB00_21255 [Pseudonocardia sp. HH130630-07]